MGVQILTAQPCDDCGSSDALTVYDWGTKCFSCNKATFKQTEDSLKVVSGSKGFTQVHETPASSLVHSSQIIITISHTVTIRAT